VFIALICVQNSGITTNVTGCRDVVEDGITGILVPPKNAKNLSEAMIKLIENPDLAVKMGKQGREKVLCEFSENIVIDKAMQQYLA